MNPAPIRPSSADLERRRLESTLDQDLASLSADSFPAAHFSDTSTETLRAKQARQPNYHIHDDLHDHLHRVPEASFANTTLTMEYPRAFGEGETTVMYEKDGVMHKRQHPRDRFPSNPYNRDTRIMSDKHDHHQPSHSLQLEIPLDLMDTPRPRGASRKASGMSVMSSMQASPTSTAGHHVSQVTLADKVFRPRAGRGMSDDEHSDNESEFDPERSLGRLVGELGKVMNSGALSPRPTSPFAAALSPPRSPSPLPSMQTLIKEADRSIYHVGDGRKTSSGSSEQARSQRIMPAQTPFKSTQTTATSSRPAPRRILSESSVHNVQPVQAQQPARTPKSKKPVGGRLAALRDENGEERRPRTAPAGRANDISADVTGLTALMQTPAKGGGFDKLYRNEDVGDQAVGDAIPAALSTLQARLRALETENTLSRQRVRELEVELEKAKQEVTSVRHLGDRRLKEVIGEKTALEDLVASLRSHVARITAELAQHTALVAELRAAQNNDRSAASIPRYSGGVDTEVKVLRRDVDRLDGEVLRLKGIVEEGLQTRRKARNTTLTPATVDLLGRDEPMGDGHMQQKPRLPSKLRQGMHAAAANRPTTMPATVRPATRISHAPPTPDASEEDGYHSPTPISRCSSASSAGIKVSGDAPKALNTFKATSSTRPARVSDASDRSRSEEGPDSPFPSIRAEDEDEFFALSRKAQNAADRAASAKLQERPLRSAQKTEGDHARFGTTDEVPPQTVLARVIAELEADFAHYKAIYSELADQYKLLDAASAVAKRHVLAEHLKEVIDTLEQKADQIAALYDLLSFQDKPVRSKRDASKAQPLKPHGSVHDVMRMVKESLGEEAFQRLNLNDRGRRPQCCT